MSFFLCQALARAKAIMFCLAAVYLTSAGFTAVQAAAGPLATGLRPPTPAEQEWMDKHLKKTKKVKLNKLGLERLNRHRLERGLAPLDLPVAEDGLEVEGDTGAEANTPARNVFEAAEQSAGSGLPSAVDNSQLPSFPPVRNQGSIGSCASFSTTYYTATHMVGLARGFDNKNNADNSTKFSPKWTYPMVNGGQDSGSWFSPTFDVLIRHGAASWADWPYSGANTPSSYREWCRDGAVWRRAANYRMAEAGVINNVNTAAGLADVKTLLADGYVLLYATDIYGWQFTTISDDRTTTADNAHVGKRIAYYVTGEASGHAMTVVGYDDNIWCDINKDGSVDPGEKGALRICNSWGSDWLPGNAGPADGGFTWLAYDALRSSSAVAGASTPNRAPGSLSSVRTAWWYNQAYWLRAQSAYVPKLLAQFTLNHQARSQLQVRLAKSSTATTAPAAYWTPSAWQNQGGAFAFDGSSTAVPGTFIADLSDIAVNGLNRYYLSVGDNLAGRPATISDFKLIDAAGNILATATIGIPGAADASTALAYLDFSLNPPTILTSGGTNLVVGSAVSFNIQASGNPTSFAAGGLPPGLGVNSANGLISGTPTQPGTFVVSLSANNASGTGSGALTINVTTSVVLPPDISSATTAQGSVGAAFSYTITADRDVTSFGANGLPSGLMVNPATGVISGIPTVAGAFTVQLTAINIGGTGTRNLALTIDPPPAGVPVISSPLTAQASVDSFFTYRITADNNPTSFGADGLPQELTVNTSSGVISGTPSLARDHTITLRASNATGTGYATLLLSVSGDSSFGPPNDAFANPSVLSGTNLTVQGGNNNATAESGEPQHAGNTASRSVWWTWTAPANGVVTLSTVGSDFDTVLAVYTGNAVNALTVIAQDDQSGGNNASRAIFNVVGGTAYALAVDGYGGAVGNITLHLEWAGATPAPLNDNFANAIVLNGTSVNVTGRNNGATAQTGEPAHAGLPASRSVWWAWTSSVTGTVRVDTFGSGFDTVLAVYTGSAVNALTPVASNDQGGPNDTSVLTFNANAGVTYGIAVDGYQGAAGNIALALLFIGESTRPLNDDFVDRAIITGASVTASGSNLDATIEAGEPFHVGLQPAHSVWWTWTAGSSGLVTVDTAGSGFDTVLAVYTGASLSGLTAIAGNDDIEELVTSRVTFPASQGENYQIAVDGYNGAAGSIVLHVTVQSAPPSNDQFANAATLSGVAPSAQGANVNASAQTDEPAHAGEFPNHSVWWVWTAPGDGLMTFSTAGSSFDTILAIYTGTALDTLNYVASADDSAADLSSTLTFWATAGVAYRIAVDGYGGDVGSILLTGGLEPAGDFLYRTDFEWYYLGSDAIVGTDGWFGFNDFVGTTGVLNAFPDLGQGGYVGYFPPLDSPVSVYRPVNFQPIAQGRPIVTFLTQMAIIDSDNSFYDQFAFSVFNRGGQLLSAIVFDNLNLKIAYDNRSGQLIDTGVAFKNGVSYLLAVTIDFAANTWSATLNGTTLFTKRTFHAGALTRDLGVVTVDWLLDNLFFPGNNFVLFDNYAVVASPVLAPPVIAFQPQSRTNNVGSLANFSVTANSTAPPRYQWQFQNGDLPNATNATLTLFNVTTNQAGAYRVRVSNPAGSTMSQSANLTVVNLVAPLQLSAPQLSTRGFEFRITAVPGRNYVVEISSNLVSWSSVSPVTADASGTAVFLDAAASGRPRGFYRVRPSQ